MKKTELEFPYNIIETLGFDTESVIENFENKLNVLVDKSLTEREKFVIFLRYKHNKTLLEIGKDLDVTKERVRQIEAKAIRKLRKYPFFFTYGKFKHEELFKDLKEEYIKLNKEKWEIESAFNFLQEKNIIANNQFIEQPEEKISLFTRIENLDFTVRTYRCLLRANLKTINDIIRKKEDEILRIRNLGVKSYKEIITKLHSYGFSLKGEENDAKRD